MFPLKSQNKFFFTISILKHGTGEKVKPGPEKLKFQNTLIYSTMYRQYLRKTKYVKRTLKTVVRERPT